MKTNLDFERDETKRLLAKLDFHFFLNQNISQNKYKKEDIDQLFQTFENTKEQIKKLVKENKKQFNYLAESKVRRMYSDGLLTALFGLDESRNYEFMNFQAIGKDWAYFNHWKKYQIRKITKEKIWKLIIRSGSILAIVLSAIKFFEYLGGI